jgi:hypothetical protein
MSEVGTNSPYGGDAGTSAFGVDRPLETCLSTGDFCPKPVIWIDVSCPAKRPIFRSFRWQRKLDQGD